jgi:hypothetical protein
MSRSATILASAIDAIGDTPLVDLRRHQIWTGILAKPSTRTRDSQRRIGLPGR